MSCKKVGVELTSSIHPDPMPLIHTIYNLNITFHIHHTCFDTTFQFIFFLSCGNLSSKPFISISLYRSNITLLKYCRYSVKGYPINQAASKKQNQSRVNTSSELFRLPIAIRVRPLKGESLKRLL